MHINPISHKKEIHSIFMVTILAFLLCSCQKQQKATIYFNSSYTTKLDMLMQEEEYEDALNLLSDRLKEIPGDSEEAASLYVFIGNIYASYLHDKDRAMDYLNRAIKIDKKNKNELGLADAYYVMSNIYVEIGGDAGKGIGYTEQAKKLYEKNGKKNSLEMANTLRNQGSLYFKSEKWERALESYETAQEILESLQSNTGYICINIGKTLIELNEFEEAEEVFQKSLKSSEENGGKYDIATALVYLGWLYTEKEEYKKSIDMYIKALDIFEADEDCLSETALVYNNLAYSTVKVSGNWEDGFPYAIKACRAIEKVEPLTESIRTDKEDYKQKLRQCYFKWKADDGEDDFQVWYEITVMGGRDSKE